MKKTWIKIGAVVFFLASFILITQRNLPQIISETAPDFTQVWKSAKALTVARDPYLDAGLDYLNGYPPVTEIFFLPLVPFPYHQALAIFTYISFASIVGSVFLSLKIAAKKVPWYYFLSFLGFSFLTFPTKFSLGLGQVNMVVLFLLLLAFFLETKPKKNSLASGLSLGIAIALKPIFAFFLLFFALKKSWKVIFISVLTVAVLIATTLIFWLPQIWISWYQTGILPMISYTSPSLYTPVNQGIFGFLYGYISNLNARIYLSRAATIILIPIAIYLVLKKKDLDLGLSFFIITLLLTDIASWQHHFVWLMFPFVVFFVNILKSKNAVLLGLLALSYFLVSWNFRYPLSYPVIIRSTQFYGAIILYGINLYFLKHSQEKPGKVDKESLRYKLFDLLSLE